MRGVIFHCGFIAVDILTDIAVFLQGAIETASMLTGRVWALGNFCGHTAAVFAIMASPSPIIHVARFSLVLGRFQLYQERGTIMA